MEYIAVPKALNKRSVLIHSVYHCIVLQGHLPEVRYLC